MRWWTLLAPYHLCILRVGKGMIVKELLPQLTGLAIRKMKTCNYGKAASPLSYVSGNTAPALFINSAGPRMHAGREDYIKVLTDHHIYSEVQNFEWAPHSFCLYEPWFTPTVRYIDSFLNKVFPAIK